MNEERPLVAKETIIVVHGTFCGLTDDGLRWWQLNAADKFIQNLHDALRRRGANPRCWVHCNETSSVFHWTGNNHWADRTKAAADLVRYLIEIAEAGWACHLVGHSHGGNVIAEALHALQGRPAEKAVRSVLTLGTPFLDALSAIERRRRRIRIRGIVTMLLAMTVFVLPMIGDVVRHGGWSSPAINVLLLSWGVILSVWLAKFVSRRAKHKREAASDPIPALAINSRYDEAWQLLHHVRETANPLAVKEGLVRYLAGRITSFARRRNDIDKIFSMVPVGEPRSRAAIWTYRLCYLTSFGSLFGPSIYSGFSAEAIISGLFLAAGIFLVCPILIFLLTLGSWRLAEGYMHPFSDFVNLLRSLAIVPTEIMTYIARAQSWTLVQRLTLGLDGFRFKFPRVTVLPDLAGAAQFTFERLPEAVEGRALAARAKWVERNLGTAADTFTKVALSAADISDLLEKLERDPSLVHAAYYTDDGCIERIAEWISKRGAGSTGELAEA